MARDLQEIARYFQRACDWFVCGRAMFDARSFRTLRRASSRAWWTATSRVPLWSGGRCPPDFGRTYLSDLRANGSVRVLTGLTATEIDCPSEASAADTVTRLEPNRVLRF